MRIFHPSLEGAQHGPKGPWDFLQFAKDAGANGCQPSNFMLDGQGAKLVKDRFVLNQMNLDGVSAHCPFWVHGAAWTGTPTILPFISPEVAQRTPAEIEQWAEDYILELLDKCAEMGVKVVTMFWGPYFGFEVATGYPWGFWKGQGYDLISEGLERFVTKTQKIRDRARSLGIVLAHEIHRGTAAMCAVDFLKLVDACDGDKSMGILADPSHCWEGESWLTRFSMPGIAERIAMVHMKNHTIVTGQSLCSMESDWKKRGMRFSPLHSGDLSLVNFVELMMQTGYPNRYCKLMNTDTAPLVVEAEAAFADGDRTSQQGVEFVSAMCCFEVAAGSFEDGMGADKK